MALIEIVDLPNWIGWWFSIARVCFHGFYEPTVTSGLGWQRWQHHPWPLKPRYPSCILGAVVAIFTPKKVKHWGRRNKLDLGCVLKWWLWFSLETMGINETMLWFHCLQVVLRVRRFFLVGTNGFMGTLFSDSPQSVMVWNWCVINFNPSGSNQVSNYQIWWFSQTCFTRLIAG